MTPAEATEIVQVLVAAFPRAGITGATIAVYAESLADLDAKDVRAAVRAALNESEFLPTIAAIRKRVFESRHTLPDAEEALREIRQAVGDVGGYGTPKFSHEAVQATVDAIGWQNICASENPEALRAHVRQVYTGYRDRYLQHANRDSAGLPRASATRFPSLPKPAGTHIGADVAGLMRQIDTTKRLA